MVHNYTLAIITGTTLITNSLLTKGGYDWKPVLFTPRTVYDKASFATIELLKTPNRPLCFHTILPTMPSQKNQKDLNQESQVSRFYDGKSILLTGAAGFLGVVLLEILLRCCPGIKRIYILLRAKKGVLPENRKESIFKKQIFYKIREKDPDAIEKVIVIPGDVSQKNLGMRDEDVFKVAQEVTIVFHCAAVVYFNRPLRYMLDQNFRSTNNIIEFCRDMHKLDALVYTSTAYSNSNRVDPIEEIVYKMPFTAKHALEVLGKGNDDDLYNLLNMCEPKYPNFYVFTKCLAENLLQEKATDLPVAIVRPSVIGSSWKGVLPGFIEGDSGIVSLCVGIGKGFVRVLRVDVDKLFDYVPVDVVANTHVIAAWCQTTQRLSSPTMYNCVSSAVTPMKWLEFATTMFALSEKYPLPNSYQRPQLTTCKSGIKYWTFSILDHYIPAIVIDTLLWITGRKPRLFMLYRYYDKAIKYINFFTLNEWHFQCENFKSLADNLNIIDSEVFPIDIREYNIREAANDIPTGAPAYQWENDKKPYEERMRTMYRHNCITSFIKWTVLGSVAILLYVIVF